MITFVCGNFILCHIRILNSQFSIMNYRNCEGLQAVGGGDDATVPVGLFLVGVVLFDETMVIAVEFLIPLYGTKIGGLQQCRRHGKKVLLRL